MRRMFRFVLLAAALFGAVALLTRSGRAQRAFWVLFAIAVVYTLLKFTGVMEAIAPDRRGTWGIIIPYLQQAGFSRINRRFAG
jgi:hypothetical protein